MARLENEFSWSASRDSRFRECLRAYWFQYYGAWGGWETEAPRRARTLYRLKNLRSRHMWAGAVVHRCVERALTNLRRGIEPMSPEAATHATIESMRDEWQQSRAGLGKERLEEHEYEISLPDAEWRAIADHVRHCLWNFYSSPLYEELRKLPAEDWLEIEELTSFEFEGTRIFVKLDLAYRNADGEVQVVDWKTGRGQGDDASMQVATYSLYAAQAWGIDPTQLETTLVNLALGTRRSYQLGPRGLEAALSRIRASLRDMRAKLLDPAGNQTREDDFPLRDEPRVCRRCAFRRVCVSENRIQPLDPPRPAQ